MQIAACLSVRLLSLHAGGKATFLCFAVGGHKNEHFEQDGPGHELSVLYIG